MTVASEVTAAARRILDGDDSANAAAALEEALHTYTWDPRDLLATVTNAESASDPAPKVTRYTWTDRGQCSPPGR